MHIIHIKQDFYLDGQLDKRLMNFLRLLGCLIIVRRRRAYRLQICHEILMARMTEPLFVGSV